MHLRARHPFAGNGVTICRKPPWSPVSFTDSLHNPPQLAFTIRVFAIRISCFGVK